MSTRRDNRAEPDDDEGSSSRVDVVNVGGGGSGDTAASGVVSLRRELAKLHQQAAAVEKSLEDQRRDRSDALDRSERATERAIQLESRLAGIEAEATSLRKMHEASLAELQSVRAERDDLSRAVVGAQAATAELGKLKEEVQRLRASADEAARTGAELAKAKEALARAADDARQAKAEIEKARKATEIAEQDAAIVGDQATRVRAEAAKLRTEAEAARTEAGSARAETTKAREDAATARTDATRALEEAKNARGDATAARADVAKALEDAITAHDEATKLREELAKSRNEATRIGEDLSKARAELARAREDLVRAKEDNTRDRATARDRIDLIERALDDARAVSTRVESELESARSNEERLGRELEIALGAAAESDQRAKANATAHAALEHSVRRLRDEITSAFVRVGHGAPPPLPRSSVVSIPPEMIESVPPDAMSIPPAPAVFVAAPRELEAFDSPEPRHDSSAPSSPASKSVPPPAPASLAPPQGSVPPPTYASVPPQLHPSTPPNRQPTAPPPAGDGAIPAGARRTAPPPGPASESPDSSSLPSEMDWSDSIPPPTRRPGGSAVPPPMEGSLTSTTREDLLVKLVDPDCAEEAAIELRQHPEWLRSVPPPTLIAALSSVDYDAEGAVFELARAWDREPLCHALIASLRSESDARLREHAAWLLKHLAAPSSWKAIADLAKSDDEPAQLRRWLLEALDRLAAGRAIGWRELGDVVTTLARDADSTLRDGVVGILVSLDRSDDKRRLLLDILRADDDEVVLASAVNGLASVLPMDLDQELMNRLLGHPSSRVQRSVRDLIERVRQTKQ